MPFRNLIVSNLALSALLLCLTFKAFADPLGQGGKTGFLSRSGNNGDAAAAAGNNIYFKLLDGNRIATLYVPWPFAQSVSAATLHGVFQRLAEDSRPGEYIRSNFTLLEEAAVATIESYSVIDGRIMFECGAMSVCSIRGRGDQVELVRPGIINEHITSYDFIVAK